MTKAPADLRSLARAHTELGIQTLAGIARNSTSDAARVQAVGMLLDRGWGKAPQPHTGEDDKDIRTNTRQIVEGGEGLTSSAIQRLGPCRERASGLGCPASALLSLTSFSRSCNTLSGLEVEGHPPAPRGPHSGSRSSEVKAKRTD